MCKTRTCACSVARKLLNDHDHHMRLIVIVSLNEPDSHAEAATAQAARTADVVINHTIAQVTCHIA